MTAQRRRELGELEFPETWLEGREWLLLNVALSGQLTDGRDFALMHGMLDDGCNLIGLCYPGGQRLIRCGPGNKWAVEERFTGLPLKDGDPLLKIWSWTTRSLVEGLADARKDTAA